MRSEPHQKANLVVLDDESLLARLNDKDEEAFAILLQRHLENTRGLAWRVLGNHADVDEIAQDVFLKLWNKPQSFKLGRAKFSTWLYRVTLNACIDKQRRNKTIPLEDFEATLSDPAPTPEKALITSQRTNRVNDAIAKLPDRQKQAIALSHFQGLNNIEAAIVLETTVEAVESLLSRARRKLKATLQKEVAELLEGTQP